MVADSEHVDAVASIASEGLNNMYAIIAHKRRLKSVIN